jgi:hypothetical protein
VALTQGLQKGRYKSAKLAAPRGVGIGAATVGREFHGLISLRLLGLLGLVKERPNISAAMAADRPYE